MSELALERMDIGKLNSTVCGYESKRYEALTILHLMFVGILTARIWLNPVKICQNIPNYARIFNFHSAQKIKESPEIRGIIEV